MLLQVTVFNVVLWGEIYEEIVFDSLLWMHNAFFSVCFVVKETR